MTVSDTQYEDNDDDPQLRDAPAMFWGMIVDEWESRTTYGRLWFPLWLLLSTFQWLLVGGIVTLVYEWDKLLSEGWKHGRRLTPRIYEEGEEESEECETA